MRIVHIVVGKVNPDSLNGVSKVVHWMATSQCRQGHYVEVWGLAGSTNLTPRRREYTMKVFKMTRLRFTLCPELKAAIAGLQSGTWVQFHSVFCPEFLAISKALRKRGFAYGVTPHGGYAVAVFEKNPWKKRLYFTLLESKYLRRAAWMQAVGASEVERFQKVAPGIRVVLIPNCLEPIQMNTSTPISFAKRPLIGFCGRMHNEPKGLDKLIDGFASYKAGGGSGQLWLIGDGEDRDMLQKHAAKSGARSDICFLGEKIGEEKFSLMASFDAFIHPSRREGLPMACLEAASLGRPLVVSRETNLAEYVERSGAGLVLDETSAAGVARALDRVQRLYDDNRLSQMGENARLLIEREFSWEGNTKSFVAAISTAGHCASEP
jgi:glycosyltransferase involved in cell wall biosynthesis